MIELEGGADGGALLVNGIVLRRAGPWTSAVASLLGHLERVGFSRAPLFLGLNADGREQLTFLPGTTVGRRLPWPSWTHSDQALVQVGEWLRQYHEALESYEPPEDGHWRTGRPWSPGDVISHNDAAPYNAVWHEDDTTGGHLVGFIDWDHAGPATALDDLAGMAFSWVPLHAHDVVQSEGFLDLDDRDRRLQLFLDAYRSTHDARTVLQVVRTRVAGHAADLRARASTDALFARMAHDGTLARLDRALVELTDDFHLPPADIPTSKEVGDPP